MEKTYKVKVVIDGIIRYVAYGLTRAEAEACVDSFRDEGKRAALEEEN